MSFEVYYLMSDSLICGPHDGKYVNFQYGSRFKSTPKVKVCLSIYLSYPVVNIVRT